MNKPVFVYPGSDFDRSRNLIAALGSFWARTYEASDQVHSYVLGTAQLANQTYQNLVETVEALSRFDIPLFHTETLAPVVLKKSERNSLRTASALFDKTAAAFNDDIKFDSIEPEIRGTTSASVSIDLAGLPGVNDSGSLNWRGVWTRFTEYFVNDVVVYNGNFYVAQIGRAHV